MKDYLSIEKGISEIIHKLNKLKKTAKDVCINISVNKRGKKRKARSNKLVSKGNQYSNVYKSPNTSLNLGSANKMNKTNKIKNNKMNKNKINSNESIESEPVESQPIESTETSVSNGSDTSMSMFETGTETKQ
jgi:hypothetical protein|uniref:Uncharacterized protein n=1 Tax=viral metagenome TaxID=1070528 RepID=A0A6C0D3P1_9ZZZZ